MRIQSLAEFFRSQNVSYHVTEHKAQKIRVTGLSHVGRRLQRKRRRRFNRSVVQQKRLSSFVTLGGLGNPSSSESRGDSVNTRRGGFFSAIALFFSTCSHGKGREHDARRLKTSAIVIRLRDSDLAGLHVLGFRQSQRHETLIDFRADFVGID